MEMFRKNMSMVFVVVGIMVFFVGSCLAYYKAGQTMREALELNDGNHKIIASQKLEIAEANAANQKLQAENDDLKEKVELFRIIIKDR